MKLSHTHDVTKYSTWVVLSDAVTIPKWRAAAILDFGKIAIAVPRIEGFGSMFVCRYKIAPWIEHVTKNAIWIKVPFLHRGWADSHKIWYADAEWHPVVESANAAAILVLGKIAITSPGIERCGSNFVCCYKITPWIRSRNQAYAILDFIKVPFLCKI